MSPTFPEFCTAVREVHIHPRPNPLIKCQTAKVRTLHPLIKAANLLHTQTSHASEIKALTNTGGKGFTDNKVNAESLSEQIEQCSTRIQNIEEKLDILDTVRSSVSSLTSRVDTLEHKIANPISSIINCAQEARKKITRSYNIILYGITEPSPFSLQSDLRVKVKRIIGNIYNINCDSISLRRIGKQSETANSLRPVIVRLESSHEVLRCLRNKKLLTEGISASTDKTPTQRDHMRQLIQHVDQHSAEHPNNQFPIKYVSGVPKVVNADSSNNFQEPPKDAAE